MIYGAIHLHDWMSWTRFYSMTEKGVLIDLIVMVLSKELPLDPSLFDRITNRYTDEERMAFEFVVRDFFTLGDDGMYHNETLDSMIAKRKEKSEKARNSIKVRWEGKTKEVVSNNERNTNELLTVNSKQLTEETTTTGSSAAGKKRSPILPIPIDPEPEWVEAAKEIRPDVDPFFVWRKMRDYYRAEKKAMTTWRRLLISWVGREHGQINRTTTSINQVTSEMTDDDVPDFDPRNRHGFA